MRSKTTGTMSDHHRAEADVRSASPAATRRHLLKAGAATGASALFGATFLRRLSAMAQAPEGEIGVRFFPFGVGVEELYQSFADEFQSENPGVSVRLDLQPWDNRYPKMLADLAAGQGPDVMFVTTDVLIRFSEAGVLAPLDELLPDETWDGYGDGPLEEITYEGTRWFAPMDQEVPIWITNQEIFERVGLDPAQPPETWDEMREVCRQVQAAGEANLWGWGYNAASATLNTTFYPFLYQAGGRPISDDGSEPTFNSEAGVEALSFIVELFDEGWSSQQYLQPIEAGQNPFILGSQAVSIHSVIANLIEIREIAPDRQYGLTPVLRQEEAWGYGGLRSWAISSDSEHPEAAAAFLSFLVRPENMVRHSEAFGAFPPKALAADQVYQDNPEIAAMSDRLSQIFGEQKHKYGRDLMPLVTPEIQAAILKEKTPQEALDDAAAAVRELFAQG